MTTNRNNSRRHYVEVESTEKGQHTRWSGVSLHTPNARLTHEPSYHRWLRFARPKFAAQGGVRNGGTSPKVVSQRLPGSPGNARFPVGLCTAAQGGSDR